MAIYYPSPTSGCRVDLLVASYQQVYNAIRCDRPTLNLAIVSEIATEIYGQALLLRGATSLLNQAAPSISQIANTISSALSQTVPGIINNVGSFLNTITAATSAVNAQQLAQAQSAQSNLISQIAGNIGGLLSNADSTVSGLINTVTGGASNVIGQASNTVGSLVNSARSGIEGLLGVASSTVGNLAAQATSGLGGLISGAGNVIGQVATTVTSGVSDVLNDAGGFLGGVLTNVGRGIGDFLADAQQAVAGAIDAITAGAATALGVAGNTIGGIADGVRGFIADLIANVQTGIGGIVERLSSIPGAVLDLGNTLVEAAGGAIGPIVETIGTFLSDPLKGIIGGFLHGEEDRVLEVVDRLYDRLLDNPETPEDLRAAVVSAKTPGAPIPAILGILVAPIVFGILFGGALSAVTKRITHEENTIFRPEILTLGDAVNAYYRGVIDYETLNKIGAMGGYTDTDIGRAVTIAAPLPSPVDLADWHHRGFIPKDEMLRRLAEHGYSSRDQALIVEGSQVIPQVADLVRFAVREAFPGQSAFDGPRGSGAPARFIETAGWHGLDPEFARSYWAAHWELPSITAAFSMYHRRLIDETQLRALLKEQDFAPEWVDNLIQVAFDPLTRVDVRRMRALGVLTKDQVTDAYRDLGYSTENARRLSDFVEADIEAGREVETQPERDLTRADLIGAYADGILSRTAAKDALSSIGYSDDESNLILDREDIRALRSERKETRAAIVEQAVAGIIDTVTLQDKMAQAEYTADEIAAALREVDRKIAATIRQPTKAELDRFRKLKLINDDDYADELRRLGYAERWIGLFLRAGPTPEA